MQNPDPALVDVCSIRLIEPVNVVATLHRFAKEYCGGKKKDASPPAQPVVVPAAVDAASKAQTEAHNEILDASHWHKYVYAILI